jgi:amino acid transporter
MRRQSARDGLRRRYALGLIYVGLTVTAVTLAGAVAFSIVSGTRTIADAFVLIGVPQALAAPVAATLLLSGGAILALGLGAPFIVAGDLMLVAVAQRRLLADHARTLRAIRRGLGRRAGPLPRPDREPARLINRLSPR